MEETASALVERLREVFIKRAEIVFAYLFGSYARGRTHNMSDVDVAIYLDKGLIPLSGPYGYKSDLLVAMKQEMRLPLDLVILNEAPLALRFRVIRDGKLLFCRDNKARLAFHEKTMRDYLDFRPMERIQQQYLLKRLATGRFGGGQGG
ncbi:type VII toxin-antitoxin system MntA family adenylyltransferase antitoxin [Moorella sp. Hama-1]|uniref:type VII toxin-antitoxin system MntA family adenylyltransferase antitoxin n=1 Tax=Moorella sp. Hama-1 TaxID=2138101 RepID=UPI000D644438|nr:nucleotidyltransferase domain-containing protein [Moorella sp. Hama-1]BCV21748.1 DNA polymerase beta-like region [Moorella sp. Hama-1]